MNTTHYTISLSPLSIAYLACLGSSGHPHLQKAGWGAISLKYSVIWSREVLFISRGEYEECDGMAS